MNLQVLQQGGNLFSVIVCPAEIIGVVLSIPYFGKLFAHGFVGGLGQNPLLHSGKEGERTDFRRLGVDDGMQGSKQADGVVLADNEVIEGRYFFPLRCGRVGAGRDADGHTDAFDGNYCAVSVVGGGNSMSINWLRSACIFIIISFVSKSHSSSASSGEHPFARAMRYSLSIPCCRAYSWQRREMRRFRRNH